MALLHVELGDLAEARRVFAAEADQYFGIRLGDARLPANLVFLAEVCAAVRDTARAPPLYEMMRPWAGHHITTGTGTGLWGSGDRYLGLLATLMGATVYTFSIILAVFLVGLGIGSSASSLVARDAARARTALGWAQLLAAAGVLWTAYMLAD